MPVLDCRQSVRLSQVGYKDENVHFAAGLDDLRDGISGGVMGRMHRKYAAEGHSMEEVRANPWQSCAIMMFGPVRCRAGGSHPGQCRCSVWPRG